MSYKPRTKQKAIELLLYWYPNDKAKFQRMSKAQVIAIYNRKQRERC